MPAKKKVVAKKSVAKKAAPAKAPKKTASKKPTTKQAAARRAAVSPPAAKRAHAKRIKERLHTAIRRAPQTVSEKEFEDVTAAMLVVFSELAAETAELFAELLARIERIEARVGR